MCVCVMCVYACVCVLCVFVYCYHCCCCWPVSQCASFYIFYVFYDSSPWFCSKVIGYVLQWRKSTSKNTLLLFLKTLYILSDGSRKLVLQNIEGAIRTTGIRPCQPDLQLVVLHVDQVEVLQENTQKGTFYHLVLCTACGPG